MKPIPGFTYDEASRHLTRPDGSVRWLDRETWPLLKTLLHNGVGATLSLPDVISLCCIRLANWTEPAARVHIASVGFVLDGTGYSLVRHQINPTVTSVWHIESIGP